MNATEKIRKRLEGREFDYGKDRFEFKGVEVAAGYLSISTDRHRLSIKVADVDVFLSAITVVQKSSDFLPAPVGNIVKLEMPAVYVKVNNRINDLLDRMDESDADIGKLLSEGELLVKIGNLAVQQRNSELAAIRLFQGFNPAQLQ